MNVLVGPSATQILNVVYGFQVNNCEYIALCLKSSLKPLDLQIFPNSYFFSAKEELEIASLKLLSRKKFDFILINTDSFVSFFSNMNEKFGIKGVTNKTANMINNKTKQYYIFDLLKIPTPKIYNNEEEVVYPYIKKSSVGSGGGGIEIIGERTFKTFQQNQNTILQEYVDGDVCSVVGHVRDRRVFIDFLFDIIPEKGRFPVESDLRYPSKYKGSIEKELTKYLKLFFDAIRLDHSPFMLDVVIRNGIMYFIDFSARLSITQILAYYSGDKNYIYNLVNSIVNSVDFEMKMEKAVIKKQLNLPIGNVKEINCTREDLVDVITLPQKVIKPKNDYDVRMNGYMIVSGKDIYEAEQKYNEVMRSMHVVYE